MMTDSSHGEKLQQPAAPLSPHDVLTDYYRDERSRGPYVQALFDASAPHYDWINGLLSFGSGAWYRRQALLRAGLKSGMSLLDTGCGTGVIAERAAAIVGPNGVVVALDPSAGMLRQAAARPGALAVQGFGESLPFADASFDRLTMGYALRHVADLRSTFSEYRRVLKPGGSLLLLEISRPASRLAYYPLKAYLKYAIPTLTRLLRRSRDAQTLMSYYWDTIDQCVPPATIMAALADAGLEQPRRRIQFGIFSEYSAERPSPAVAR